MQPPIGLWPICLQQIILYTQSVLVSDGRNPCILQLAVQMHKEQDYSLLKARLTVNCNAKLSAAHAGRVSAMLGRLLRAGMHSHLQKKTPIPICF